VRDPVVTSRDVQRPVVYAPWNNNNNHDNDNINNK
jgi:hypothetical protein